MFLLTFPVKNELLKLFPDEAEAVIQLAMESADFDLETATTILFNSQKEQMPPLPRQPVRSVSIASTQIKKKKVAELKRFVC